MSRADAASAGGYARQSALASIGVEALAALETRAETVTLQGGEVLFARGETGDAVYLVEAGRLEVSHGGDPAAGIPGQVIAQLGRGDLVGEMALLADVPRNATVAATRDTRLRRFDSAQFAELMATSPELGRELSALVVKRLIAPPHSGARRPTTVAIVPVGPDPLGVHATIDALTGGPSAVGIAREADRAGRSEAGVLTWLDDLEADHDLLVYDSRGDDDWQRLTMRQADLVLVAVRPGTPPRSARAVLDRLTATHARLDVVIVNDPGASVPYHAGSWTDTLQPARVHQLVVGDAGTARRLQRLVSGTGVGVLFSGGGARGLAHLGAWRALVESGIGVDAVAGVSMGSLFGGAAAVDYEPRVLYEEIDEKLVRGRSLWDPTWPVAAVLRGRRLSTLLEEVARERCFENTWRDFFCTSSNLTSGRVEVHRRGPLWRAIRSSMAIPGLFPPCRSGDDVLVDGAVFDNMPVGLMRDMHPGISVIGIDVGTQSADLLAGHLPATGDVSGWRVLARRLARRGDARVPNVAQIMLRVVDLAGDDTGTEPDVRVRPDVDGIPLLAFKEIARLDAAGYEATSRALAESLSASRAR
jgi:NTE family protein